MSVRHATRELIAQRVQSVLDELTEVEVDVVAVRAEPAWDGPTFDVGDRRVHVEACSSPLAVRAALASWAVNGHAPAELLVLICDAADGELGADVLARFTPARVLGLEPWQAATALFGVRHLDAAFRKEDGWIANALLAHVPTETARSMTGGGVLTKEVALDALALSLLGAESLTVDAVMAAATEVDPFAGLADAAPPARDGLLRALADGHGPLGGLVSSVIAGGKGGALLVLGLVCRAVYGGGDLDGGRAAGRLEAMYVDDAIAPAAGAALAERSEEALKRMLVTDPGRATAVIADAATLAARIEAASPELSDLLPAGHDRRLGAAAALVAAVLDAPARSAEAVDPHLVDHLGRAVSRVGAHHESETPGGQVRFGRLDMAARLAVWLRSGTAGDPVAASFEQAATTYAGTGAWVDHARRRLWRGDLDPEVGEVYRRVLQAVARHRDVENRRFAELLSGWTATPSSGSELGAEGLVAVEDVAGRILAPFVAGGYGVLFVVLDGCGLPSFVELAPQFGGAGYREVNRTPVSADAVPRRLTGIAALPTVTEISRASLIAGRLDRGNQEHERRAFAANDALTVDGRPAVLFHQNRVEGAAGSALAVAVADALAIDGPGAVGVVINTIDDQLKRGIFTETLRLEDLHSLRPLLDAARTHGRLVVIAADHGHVLAQPDDGGTGTYGAGGSGGERWRVADRPAADDEVLLRGDRVLLGGEAGILAPWEDDLRYGARAGGYHGGATPEEVLVPVAVFVPAGVDPPAGWELVTAPPPLWWNLEIADVRGIDVDAKPATAGKRPGTRRRKRGSEGQSSMFEVAGPVPGAAIGGEPPWLGPLLGSDVWKLQTGAAGRAPLPEDRVRDVLTSLDRRGGVSSFAALAADTGVPAARLPGFLAVLARVLNVDGYAVLDVDASTGEVRLALPILAHQFEIAVGLG